MIKISSLKKKKIGQEEGSRERMGMKSEKGGGKGGGGRRKRRRRCPV